jgi:murein DD-endopeptidase MepM/ murein hydrolase activator NlpD
MATRRLAFGILATLASAGCAVTNTPYRPGPLPGARLPSPNAYSDVERAPLRAVLLACNGGGGSNLGEIGAGGEVSLYTPYIFTAAGPLLRNPTEAACLSSGFGWRGSAEGGGRQHNGLDLANPSGGYIYAAGDGWVRGAEWQGGYGLVLEIDHGEGVVTRYAHLSEIDPNLRSGFFVAAGAAVARMGATGNATGVHLHYEVLVDGALVDPLGYGIKGAGETPVA